MFKHNKEDKHFMWKFSNGLEISLYYNRHNFTMQYDLGGYFDTRHEISFSPGYGWLIVHLPWGKAHNECDPPRYGAYYFESALWFLKNRKVKAVHMPWSYDWHRTSLMLRDTSFEHETRYDRKEFYKEEWKKKAWVGRYHFTYVLKNGTVQERLATVTVEEREWRMRWFKWTKIFAKVSRDISVEFSGEIGERTGSYKGGTMGCGYQMRNNESPLSCLRRMEKERKF